MSALNQTPSDVTGPALYADHAAPPTRAALPFSFDDVTALLARCRDLDRPVHSGAQPIRLAELAAQTARVLPAPGTPVILALSNGRALLEHYFAVLFAGGVPLTVSPATPAARLAALAETVQAGAVVAARPDASRLHATSVKQLGSAQVAVLPTRGEPLAAPGMVLMSTSGTSGMYSVCLHRVDALVRNARRHCESVGLRADDTVLVTLPLFYSYAVVAQALAALATGAALAISGPPFSPAQYPVQLKQHGITSSSITPTIARLLLHRGEHIPHSLRMLTVGGDSLAARHTRALLSALPDTEVYLTYGLTEAGPRVSTLAAHREPDNRLGSVGRPLHGVRATVRDPQHAAPEDEGAAQGLGELLVETDTALVGKLGGAGARRALVRPGLVATGDRFRVDEDGYLYFEGRLSEFVIVRGEKVSLAAVRRHVLSVPGVASCAISPGTEPDGSAFYALDVRTGDAQADDADAERIRREILSFLLPAERPRELTIGPLEERPVPLK